MIDNTVRIRSCLKFSGGIFYYLQVLQRKKDNPEQSWITRQRYSRLVKSLSDFDDSVETAKKIADLWNARVYIDLSPGSFEKLTLGSLKELSIRIYNKAYNDTYKIFDKLAQTDEVKMKGQRRWMLDIDYKEDSQELHNIGTYLRGNPEIHIDEGIPTLNGIHLIILPFNYKTAFSDLELLDSDNNYRLKTGEIFGLKFDCNTLLYYGK